MKYKIVKENKPTLKNFGRYKAVADHPQGEVDTASIIDEVGKLNGVMPGALGGILTDFIDVINRHLRRGEKVRVDRLGLLKLEILSDKVDAPEEFNPREHIKGVRLHILPESSKGSPALYKGIRFEATKER